MTATPAADPEPTAVLRGGGASPIAGLRALGQAHYDLGDLPAAGAAWFAAGARGPHVDAAVEAWRSAHGDDFAAMWDSLPAVARDGDLSPRLEALRDKANAARAAVPQPKPDEPEPGPKPAARGSFDVVAFTAWVLAAAFVFCGVVGLVTILNWLFR